MITAKSENSRNSNGFVVTCNASSIWLNAPLRPRKGIHAMVRMMPEVQNGIAHSRNSTVRVSRPRTWNTRNQAMLNPRNSVIAQTMKAKRNELT